MDKNQNAVDEFLSGLEGDEKSPLKTEDTDPFAVAEKKEVVKEEENDEKLPFNKDPKLQRYIAKEAAKEAKKLLEQQQPRVIERIVEKEKEVSKEENDVITRLIGNDTPEKLAAAKDFRNYLSGLKDEAKQEVIRDLQEQAEQEKMAENEAVNELEQGFERVEERFEVDLTSNNPNAIKVRNEFIDFVRKVSPKNEDGQVTAFPDLEETFEVFQASRKSQPNTRAKELAARGMDRSAEVIDGAQPKDQSWGAVQKIFDRLMP